MTLTMLCSIIFFTRIIDVSLGTFVTILTIKDKKLIATILGFIDILIWFLVVKEALNTNIKSIWIAISYAGGYAIGTYLGTTLSNILINGKVSVQVILNDNSKYVDKIRNNGFAVSEISCTGKNKSKKTMLFIEADKKHLNHLKKLIKRIDNKAFMVINETKYVENGFFK